LTTAVVVPKDRTLVIGCDLVPGTVSIAGGTPPSQNPAEVAAPTRVGTQRPELSHHTGRPTRWNAACIRHLDGRCMVDRLAPLFTLGMIGTTNDHRDRRTFTKSPSHAATPHMLSRRTKAKINRLTGNLLCQFSFHARCVLLPSGCERCVDQ
jgi:hypothetical protein